MHNFKGLDVLEAFLECCTFVRGQFGLNDGNHQEQYVCGEARVKTAGKMCSMSSAPVREQRPETCRFQLLLKDS